MKKEGRDGLNLKAAAIVFALPLAMVFVPIVVETAAFALLTLLVPASVLVAVVEEEEEEEGEALGVLLSSTLFFGEPEDMEEA